MAESFIIKQGDTAPALRVTLKNFQGTAVDVSAATVKFTMVLQDGTVKVNEAAVTSVDAANGVVEYRWAAGDTDASGHHRGEFEVTHSDGNVETFPNEDHIIIKVKEQLA